MRGHPFLKLLLIIALMAGLLGAAVRNTPLVEAVKNDDVAAVRALLQKGANVNEPEVDGSTALHWAVYRNDIEMVEILIKAQADARAVNRYHVAPLSLACVNGNPAIVKRLLTAGADPNTSMPGGETAVMTAARSGNPEVLKLLIAQGAEVNATETSKGQTALMWAAAANNAGAIDVLVKAGANIKARSRPSPALSGSEPGDKGFTAFTFAARAGNIEAARTLLALGADVNETLSDGTSALVLATISARYEMAAFLLDNGADANTAAQGWTALHQIVYTRRPSRGLNTVGPVARGRVDSISLVRKLIAKGANINARVTKEMSSLYSGRNTLDRIGATPFFLAASRVDVELMKELLAHGADPTIPNEKGTTPLMVAAGVGLYSPGETPGTAEEAGVAVKLCLEHGNDPNVVDANGDTALLGAAFRGSPSAVLALVAAGARIDAKNDITPMHRSSGAKATTGWNALMIADGIFLNAIFKSEPETAALLRRLMKERGISTDYVLEGQSAASEERTPPK